MQVCILDNKSSTYENLRVIIQLIKVFDSNRFCFNYLEKF